MGRCSGAGCNMLRPWLQILPVFIYKRLARRLCADTHVNGRSAVMPSEDLIVLNPPKPRIACFCGGDGPLGCCGSSEQNPSPRKP